MQLAKAFQIIPVFISSEPPISLGIQSLKRQAGSAILNF